MKRDRIEIECVLAIKHMHTHARTLTHTSHHLHLGASDVRGKEELLKETATISRVFHLLAFDGVDLSASRCPVADPVPLRVAQALVGFDHILQFLWRAKIEDH